MRITRSPADVFVFLRDKDLYPLEPGSPVLALDRITEGPIGVGTRYREVVRMLPLVKGEILSVLTRYEPPRHLEESFAAPAWRATSLMSLWLRTLVRPRCWCSASICDPSGLSALWGSLSD